MPTITARTQVCAVIGDPVEHSLSPELHNAAFAALELDFAYVAFHVKRGHGREAVEAVRALALRGLSVTIPHKVDVIPHLDEVDEVARHIGSVNTVVNNDGTLVGYSTDGPGAIRALAADGVDPAGMQVLLLGSGGAARALAFTLATLDPQPKLAILGIEEAELKNLAGELRKKTAIAVEEDNLTEETLRRRLPGADLVMHATPVGMTPKVESSIVPPGLIRPGQVVFDAVYTPLETKLLREARAAGAQTVPGLGMFVHQAAIQFELWTGRSAPIDLLTDTVKRALGETA
jgi:shikimate dehydrogenase